ncbi:MAG: hypothetical protein AABO58_20315 [Acidobacteriota bacterium]
MNESRSVRPFLFATLIGIIGGAALILTTFLSRRGQMIFLPYGLLITAVSFYFYSHPLVSSFRARFGVSLAAFMLATIILDTYLVVIVNPSALHGPIWHYVWPLGVLLLIGFVVSAVVAKVTPARTSSA